MHDSDSGALDTLVDPRRPVTADCEQALAELEGEPVDCDVCDDTGEVLGGAGRHGREVLPCGSCDAYDRKMRAAEEGPWL